MDIRKWKHWMGISALLFACAGAYAQPQPYPTRSITLVVPFNAGGPTDTLARILAQSLGKQLGQSVVVENIGGAGGTLGAARVAKANADGYTLLMDHLGLATAPTLYKNLPYDTRTAFSAVGLITEAPMAIIVRPALPAHTLKDLATLMKERPGDIVFGHSGLGGVDQLCGLLLMTAAHSRFQLIPYRGNAPVMADMLGGRVDVTCSQLASAAGYITSGKARGLAMTAAKRSPVLPDLPTTREAGLPQVDITVWNGLFAPHGTPAPVIQRLAQGLQAALKDPELSARFLKLGTEPESAALATPAALTQRLNREIDRWAPVIRSAQQYAN